VLTIASGWFFGLWQGTLLVSFASTSCATLAFLFTLRLSPAEAGKKKIEIDTFTQPMSGVDRAILEGETDGFVRVHVKKGHRIAEVNLTDDAKPADSICCRTLRINTAPHSLCRSALATPLRDG